MTTQHPPLDDRIFYKEAISLQQAGYEVTVMAKGEKDGESDVEGINILEVASTWGRFRSLSCNHRMLEKALGFKPDLVHCHEPESLAIAYRVKKRQGSLLVYDAHEDYPAMIKIGQTSGLTKRLSVAQAVTYEKRFCPDADHIFAATEPLATHYLRFGPNVTPLYNFPRRSIFHPIRDPKVESRYEGKDVFVYVGGLPQSRGPSVMVQAILELARDNPNVVLSILSHYQSSVVVEDLNPDERNWVDFLGWVDHIKVPSHLTIASAGLVLLERNPLYEIAIPIKMFEYMACGIPVIASKLPELAKFLAPLKAGILLEECLGKDDLVKAMKYILEHPREARAMGQRGLKAVKKKYNWSFSEKDLLRVYAKLERKHQ